MLSILAVILYFGCLWWASCRYPWAIVINCLLLFSFTLRVIGATYVDLFGPLFASELNFDVGPGSSAPLFVATVLLVIGLIVAFQARLQISSEKIGKTLLGIQPRRLASLALLVSSGWVVACYAEMIAIGPIPFLLGMDRIEYQDMYAGVLYELSYSMAFMFAVFTGYFFTIGRVYQGQYDYRFLHVMGAQMLFFFLTGNRFGIYYVLVSFFLIPVSSILLMKSRGGLLPPDRTSGALHGFLTTRTGGAMAVAVAAAVLIGILVNNTYNVRYTGDAQAAQSALFERTLVQPIELYTVTWDRIVTGELGDANLAWDLIFGNPIDPTRNTGIQYLMVAAVGEQRATEILDVGSQYAGGYPEVLIELFGLQFFTLPMVAVALIVALLFRVISISVCYGRFLTFIFSTYVLFAFLLLYLGGMLTSLLPWTFWIKMTALIAALLFEPYLMRFPQTENYTSIANKERRPPLREAPPVH